MGMDIAAEAVDFARAHYPLPNLAFVQASCTALPFADGAFDLVVAFEVIEHLEDWRGLSAGSRGACSPLPASSSSPRPTSCTTPNRAARRAPIRSTSTNSISRSSAPELGRFFPHVSLFLENHVEGVTFQPHEPGHTVEVRVDAGEPAPDEIALLRGGVRAPAADRQSDLRLRAARRQRAARTRAAHRRCWKASWPPRTSGSTKAQRRASRTCIAQCSASRRRSWSAATAGPKS